MSHKILSVKHALDYSLDTLCNSIAMFTDQAGISFTRNRKIPLKKLISFILSIEGGTLKTEMLRFFGCSAKIASTSALVQQRAKLSPDAFSSLFDLFVHKTDRSLTYRNLRLIAVDGSAFTIPTNPQHTDSYIQPKEGQKAYNLLHLSAMYDLLQHTYLDAEILGKKKANERASLCNLVDRSSIPSALIIADRGFESYNVMAHIQEKGWKFLIRIQDAQSSTSIASGLDLPSADSFDTFIDLRLSNIQTKENKILFQDKNRFKYLGSRFDFFSEEYYMSPRKPFYHLPFRVVRFKIADNTYETVVTNLDKFNFPANELKILYNMRWGIETSFRQLKYTIGLLHFHAKKVEYIYQEVFARLIMYNFTELITSPVIIRKADTKYAYKANFSVAVHVCRQFFLGNVSPPDVEALIRRHVSPVRPGRSRPRKMTVKHAVSFVYRVA